MRGEVTDGVVCAWWRPMPERLWSGAVSLETPDL